MNSQISAILDRIKILPSSSEYIPVLHFSISVVEVEKITSINFFPELPDCIESQIEKDSFLSVWEK
jgi:hypothetical protein